MIDVYSWPTPNGHKVHIMLEETGLEYQVHAVDIAKGEQFKPEFLAISPNNRIPAIVDKDGPGGKPLALFESGAILIYLAEKTGKFLPADPQGRYHTIQWLMWQMGGVGPMLGQCHHFRHYAPEKIEYGINRYSNEAKRLYGVADKQLAKTGAFIAGDYSIADMAIYPWFVPFERQGIQMSEFRHVEKWMAAIRERPAVQAGMRVLKDYRRDPATMDAKAKDVLFGATQFQRR
ncbi:MAG: glutathione S-transferase family protein [Alphaproteobacteria bacterium]|nr:glutathione S-transferase family protein [Alphaproteobacteria bacterium]